MLKKRDTIVAPEVDHVWEIQVLRAAVDTVVIEHGHVPSVRARDTLRTLVNGVQVLNVTSHVVNAAKCGPGFQMVCTLLYHTFTPPLYLWT